MYYTIFLKRINIARNYYAQRYENKTLFFKKICYNTNMKRIILLTFILISFSCTKNIQTGTNQNGSNDTQFKKVLVEFYSRDYFCEINKELAVKMKSNNLAGRITTSGLSKTILSFEFSEEKLKYHNLNKIEITESFLNYIAEKYPGVSAFRSGNKIIVEYTVCERVNYGDLRSFKHNKIPINEVASLKVSYKSAPEREANAPYAVIEIFYDSKKTSRNRVITEAKKQIEIFEKTSGNTYRYNIK